MNKLKPCPFCGKMPEVYEFNRRKYYGCGRDECYTAGFNGTVTKSIWNTRPIEDDLRNRIAELEAELGKDVDLTIVGLRKELLNAQSRIAELEAAQRWIPVSERLPEDGKPVWVCTIWNEQHSGFLIDGVWVGLFRDFREGEITHWMPLPEPPIVYGKVCGEARYLDAKENLQDYIAPLESQLKITDELLKEATETIGAVVACCNMSVDILVKSGRV